MSWRLRRTALLGAASRALGQGGAEVGTAQAFPTELPTSLLSRVPRGFYSRVGACACRPPIHPESVPPVGVPRRAEDTLWTLREESKDCVPTHNPTTPQPFLPPQPQPCSTEGGVYSPGARTPPPQEAHLNSTVPPQALPRHPGSQGTACPLLSGSQPASRSPGSPLGLGIALSHAVWTHDVFSARETLA